MLPPPEARPALSPAETLILDLATTPARALSAPRRSRFTDTPVELPVQAILRWRLLLDRGERLAALKDNPPAHGRLVLSDRAMHASRALGLAYEMPPDVHRQYLDYGLDLAPIPGADGKHWLPLPAALVVDAAGRITFVHTDPDIRQRVDPAALLAAARAARK